jgi:hypothetical protein
MRILLLLIGRASPPDTPGLKGPEPEMAMEKCTIDVHEQKSIALGATESLILHWCKILLTFGVLALKVL